MKQRFLNTADLVAHNIKQVFYMKPPPLRRRTELYSFNNPSTVNSIISGSDKELGGSSECSVDWVQDKNANNHHLLFKGNLSFDLPPGALNPASGYCGFRTKKLIGTFFGSLKHDLSLFSHLEIKARNPDPLKKYYLNITPDSYTEVDLYQFPLKFSSNSWHTFRIPFSKFILTHAGAVTDVQAELPADKIKTIGVSILKQPGPFHLEVTHFAAVNPDEISLEELEIREMRLDEEEEELADPKLKDLFHTVKVYVEGDEDVKTYEARLVHSSDNVEK